MLHRLIRINSKAKAIFHFVFYWCIKCFLLSILQEGVTCAKKRKSSLFLIDEDGICWFKIYIEKKSKLNNHHFNCCLVFLFHLVSDEESTIEEQEFMEGHIDHKAELNDLAKDGTCFYVCTKPLVIFFFTYQYYFIWINMSVL